MVFEHIEKLKAEYTDRYVVVDESRPELRRFTGQTGVVKTVNMGGRALVEFDGHANIGWYDIEVDFLKVVDQPGAGDAPAEPAAEAPKAKKAPSNLEKARSEKESKKAGGKMSVAEMMAAARAEKTGEKSEPKAEAAPAKEEPKKSGSRPSVADMLASARAEKGGGGEAKAEAAPAKEEPKKEPQKPAASEEAPAAGGKADRSKMSVADMLAAARAEKSGAAPAEEAPAEEPAAEEPVAEEPVAEEPTTEEPAEEPAAEESSVTPRDQLPTDTEGIIEYCRKTDS